MINVVTRTTSTFCSYRNMTISLSNCQERVEWEKPLGTDVVRNLNEVLIRVTNINRQYFPFSSSALNGTDFDGNTCCRELIHHDADGCCGDKTQISRACSGTLCFGIVSIVDLMQIDFLLTKSKCLAIPQKRDDLKAQDFRVKITGFFKACDSQNEMIKSVN